MSKSRLARLVSQLNDHRRHVQWDRDKLKALLKSSKGHEVVIPKVHNFIGSATVASAILYTLADTWTFLESSISEIARVAEGLKEVLELELSEYSTREFRAERKRAARKSSEQQNVRDAQILLTVSTLTSFC